MPRKLNPKTRVFLLGLAAYVALAAFAGLAATLWGVI